jgi:hypothetical protein
VNHDKRSTHIGAIWSALKHAENAIILTALNQRPGPPDREDKVRALEDVLVAVCSVLRELVEFIGANSND